MMYSIGDLVTIVNREGLLGEVVGLATTVDGTTWQWGAAKFSAGPYVVNAGDKLVGVFADDLAYPNWNNERALLKLWRAVFGKESAA